MRRVADNEKNNTQERIIANALYYKIQEDNIRKQADYERSELLRKTVLDKEQILGRQLTIEEIMDLNDSLYNQTVAITDKQERDVAKLKSEGIEAQRKILAEGVKNNYEAYQQAAEKRIAQIETDEAKELAAENKKLQDGTITYEQYEKNKLVILKKYNQLKIQEENAATKKLIAIAKAAGMVTASREKKLADLEVQITEDKNKEKADAENRFKELKKQLYQEIKETVFAFIDAEFEKEKNKLEHEKTMIDERRDAELKRIEALNLTDEERANRIKILDAKTEAEKRAIERRQKQVDIQKAKAEKLKAIFEIAVTTGKNIAGASTYLTNPLTAPMYPGIVALITAIGALQLARVLASPIPQYYTGTEDSKGGLVWLGERGKELLITPKGDAYETPGTAIMASIPEHSTVIAHDKYMDMLRNERVHSVVPDKKIRTEKEFFNMQMLMITKQQNAQIIEKLDKLINKPDTVLNISPDGIALWKKTQQHWLNYINKSVRFRKDK